MDSVDLLLTTNGNMRTYKLSTIADWEGNATYGFV